MFENRNLKNYQWKPLPAAGGNIVGMNYIYGASRGSPKTRVSDNALKVASMDYASDDTSLSGLHTFVTGDSINHFTHGRNGRYAGVNQLWFDGHVNWHDDPNAAWYGFNTYIWGAGATANNQGNRVLFWRQYQWTLVNQPYKYPVDGKFR